MKTFEIWLATKNSLTTNASGHIHIADVELSDTAALRHVWEFCNNCSLPEGCKNWSERWNVTLHRPTPTAPLRSLSIGDIVHAGNNYYYQVHKIGWHRVNFDPLTGQYCSWSEFAQASQAPVRLTLELDRKLLDDLSDVTERGTDTQIVTKSLENYVALMRTQSQPSAKTLTEQVATLCKIHGAVGVIHALARQCSIELAKAKSSRDIPKLCRLHKTSSILSGCETSLNLLLEGDDEWL